MDQRGASRRKGVIQRGGVGRSHQGKACTPGTLPSAPAVASSLCFPEYKPGRNSLPQIHRLYLLVAVSLMFPSL